MTETMIRLTRAGIIINGFMTIGIFITCALIYRQITATKEASQNQCVFPLIEHAHKDIYIRAGQGVFAHRVDLQNCNWQDLDNSDLVRNLDNVALHNLIDSANKMCALYSLMGVLVKNGVVPFEVIDEEFGTEIQLYYGILSGYLEDVQRRGNPQYWSGFKWLADKITRGPQLLNPGPEQT